MAVTIRDIKVICTAPEGINLLVVKVETSEPGLYGLGCGTFAYRHLTVQHLIETYLRPLLIGKDVRNITELWQLMHQNAYWRCGPIVNNAISGIDMALWDIKGKMANMPVYDLFGGKMRAGVPVYRHVDGSSLDEIVENIEMYRSIGVRICWHGPGDMSPLAHAANIHIDLAAENLGLQEWSGIEPPNFVIQKLNGVHGELLDVFPGMPEYGNDGFVYANEKPGLGVDIDEKEAAKYPCENTVTTWTQTRNRDGSLAAPAAADDSLSEGRSGRVYQGL